MGKILESPKVLISRKASHSTKNSAGKSNETEISGKKYRKFG